MLVAIAGAHGKIATRLARLLADRGDDVIGLIRNPDHAADVSGHGASPVVCDLEQAALEDIAHAIAGADARSSPPARAPAAGPSASSPWTATGRSSSSRPPPRPGGRGSLPPAPAPRTRKGKSRSVRPGWRVPEIGLTRKKDGAHTVSVMGGTACSAYPLSKCCPELSEQPGPSPPWRAG